MMVMRNGIPSPTGFRYVANVPPAAIGPQFAQATTRSTFADMLRPALPGLLLMAALAAAVFYAERR